MENLLALLEEASYQLTDMWRAADDSVADYILQIETAVNFINKALKTQDRLDIFNALQKAYDVLEVEYNETPEDEEYDNLVDRIKNALDGLDETKNYIKEFREYDREKNTPIKFEPRVILKEEAVEDPTKIEEKELKNIVTEAVINFMNSDNSKPSELLYEHKMDLAEKVKLYENRNGFLGMYFTDDKELNECSVGAIIDPTNRKNWMAMKQETFYKLPYCYKDDLRLFVNELRDLGKTENVGDEYLDQLRQQVKDANNKADSRYHEVYGDYLRMWAPSGDDPHAKTMFGQPSNEAHRMALQDGTYQSYKSEARKLENKLHVLEKRLKK